MLRAHVGDFKDKELDDLVSDLAQLFHDREWFLSGDTCSGDWNTARDEFKRKWFTEHGRTERVEQYLASIRQEVLAMFSKGAYCGDCANWTPQEGTKYGWCKVQTRCLWHKNEDVCEMFERRKEE